MVKNLFVSGVVALVVSLAVLFSGQQSKTELGGVNNVQEEFTAGLVTSALGGNTETFASGSVTFKASQICSDTLIVQSGILGTAVASAQSNTFPSGSSLISGCLPNKGDSRVVRFENQSTIGRGRFTYTFVTGSNMDVFVASTSNTGAGTNGLKLAPEQAALVRFSNLNGSSVSADFIKFVNGD